MPVDSILPLTLTITSVRNALCDHTYLPIQTDQVKFAYSYIPVEIDKTPGLGSSPSTAIWNCRISVEHT